MWSVDIDGTDITSLCQSIVWHPKLSRPASLVVRVPGHLVSVTNGVSEMHLTNGSLLFSGTCWFTENSGDPNATYTSITAYDHLIYLGKRLCKTPNTADYPPAVPNQITDPDHPPGPCNLADPSLVLSQESTAPAIMAAFINATNQCDPAPMPLTVGSVSGSGPDMSGAPAEWPMNIADMAETLLSAGWLNMVVHPGIGSSTVDLLTPPSRGGPVRDLTGSVSLDYATGNYNSQTATNTSDMETVTNALWYLGAPRVHWWPLDMSHWRWSITPTAPHREDDGDPNEPSDQWPPSLIARWMGSRATYGYMQEIQVHDDNENKQESIRPLFEEMYANEAYLRAVPRSFISIKPERQSGGSVTFLPGDQISVNAGTKLGGGFSGSVLVYEYEITVAADGVSEYTQLLASPDAGT